MERKKGNPVNKEAKMLKKKENRIKSKKLKQMMKKRLIVRNLSFKVSEEDVKKIFSNFGEVEDVNIPLNAAGLKRGFAFVRYKDTKSQVKAMKALNFKKIHGRPIAIDFAVNKTTYQTNRQGQKPASNLLSKDSEPDETKLSLESEDSANEDVKPNIKIESDSDTEDEDDNDEDKKVKTFLKEFDADKEIDESSEDESSEDESTEGKSDDDDDDDDDDDNESQHSDETAETSHKASNKRHSQDVSEGKTVFIRNVSFKNMEEDLKEVAEEYGKTEYCLLCVDPLTGYPKGTAFVKFKEKESANRMIEQSFKEPGILLDGRKLLCANAVSRVDASGISNKEEKIKDKRNLRLLKCGLIMYGSKEAEGVSQTDMAKRAQLEGVKKQKLRNINFFVSDKRLAIHNLPKNITDKDIRILFKKSSDKGAIIKEARVMKDFKKTDTQGIPVSRGFGFVSFTEHEHALKALTGLNNNPRIFTSQKRPIVEFSVENKVALLSQQRKREIIQMRNKKRMEEKLANANDQTEDNKQQSPLQLTVGKKRKGKGNNKDFSNRKIKRNFSNTQFYDDLQKPKTKKKQKTPNKNKNKRQTVMTAKDSDNLTMLTNKYKEKLLNKFS